MSIEASGQPAELHYSIEATGVGPASTLDMKDLPVMTELPLLGMPSLCSKDAR